MPTDENLSAPQDGAQDLPALRVENLPDRQMAIMNITDVLPDVAFQGLGGLAGMLTDDQIAEIEEPLSDDDIEIRPEGLIYASHGFYRRKLNKIFGYLGWSMRPMSPLKPRMDKSSGESSEWYRVWALYVQGCFVAVAMDSYTLREKNKQMNLSDVDESIHSGCLKRCCKDFLAPELQDKRWRQRKMRELGVKVVARTWKGNEELWRRKDEDPLDGELTSKSAIGNTDQSGSQRTDRARDAEAGSASNSTTSTPQPKQTQTRTMSGAGERNADSQNSQNARSSVTTATEQRASQNAADQSRTGARGTDADADAMNASAGSTNTARTSSAAAQSGQSSQSRNVNSTEQTVATNKAADAQNAGQRGQLPPGGIGRIASRGPVISQSQLNMILARSRTYGLIVEQDPTYLMELLDTRGVDLIDTEGRTKMENCIATLKQIYMKDVNQLLKAIDAAKQADEGGAERI